MENRGERIKSGLMHCSEDGCKGCPYEEDCKLGDGGSDLAAETLPYIEELEKQQTGWISVKERLPDKNQRVLVLTQQWITSIGRYSYTGDRGAIWFRCGRTNIVCAYWAKIPELP